MSEENVELVRRVYEAHERGDFDAVFAAYDPEIEWHTPRLQAHLVDSKRPSSATQRMGIDSDAMEAGFEPVYVGHDGVRAFWRHWFSAWQSVSFDYEEFIDAGEHVIIVLSQRVRGRASGIELEMNSYAQVWTVREGKIVRVEFFPTRGEAVGAVGLRE